MPQKSLNDTSLNNIQSSWLKAKVIEFGTKMSIIYFSKQKRVNPDAKCISDYLNEHLINEGQSKTKINRNGNENPWVVVVSSV